MSFGYVIEKYNSLSKQVSKGQTVWPLEQLTSKSSCTRYLKNYLSDFYEIWCAYATSHGEYLYSFWGSGNVKC